MCLACGSPSQSATHALLNATLPQPWRLVVPAGQAATDALTTGLAWAGGAVTFGFPISAADYALPHYYSDSFGEFVPFGAAQRDATRLALTGVATETDPGWRVLAVEDFTGLRLTEAPGAEAAIRFGLLPLFDAAGVAFDPGPVSESGDVFLHAGITEPDPVPGDSSFRTLLHEIGHALGLKHPHESWSAFPKLDPAADFAANSVMSYSAGPGISRLAATMPPGEASQSWMMLDILTLQRLYGVNWSFRATDTVYRWDMTTGEMFVDGVGQGVPAGRDAARVFATLWDGGGRDLLDLSNAAGPVTADLGPGGWITFSEALLATLGVRDLTDGRPAQAPGNIALALAPGGNPRALFEDVTGGAGADRLTGNLKGNRLSGGASDDLLDGLAGNDTLTGGFGADTLRGGEGRDIARYGDGLAWLDLADASFGAGEARGDVLEGIEVLIFGAGGNRVRGGAGAELIQAGAGNDTLDGGAGRDLFLLPDTTVGAGGLIDASDPARNSGDYAALRLLRFEAWQLGAGADTVLATGAAETVMAGAGDDLVRAGGGADELGAGEGADTLEGGAGHDWLVGDGGRDLLLGGTGNDTLFGGARAPSSAPPLGTDDDRLAGEAGQDSLSGGAGADTLEGGTGHDWLGGDGGHDLLLGGTGNDTLIGGERSPLDATLPQGTDDDRLAGEAGHDSLGGGTGADTLEGGTGNDTLAGGAGDDRLVGGTGADRFEPDIGADTLDGGTGRDLAVLATIFVEEEDGGFYQGAEIDLTNQAANAGAVAGKLFLSVERFVLTWGDDIFDGSAAAEEITGLFGVDELRGGRGADTLYGTGEGWTNDLDDPEAGLFIYGAPEEGGDLILDFRIVEEFEDSDSIGLIGEGFGELEPGDLPEGLLVIGAAPVAAGAFGTLLYDSGTGALSWDADGTGAAAPTLLATLAGAPALTAADIVIL